MSDEKKLSITYSSGLIPPPGLMSTLAVFYDEIWLPNSFNKFNSWDIIAPFLPEELRPRLKLFSIAKEYHISEINKWKHLYDKGNLKEIPIKKEEELDMKNMSSIWLNAMHNIRKAAESGDDQFNYLYTVSNMCELAYHTVFASKPSPEIFISNSLDTNSSRLSTLIAQNLFQYQVPKLQELNAEQILEVRDYLRDTKEGFSYYINELTDDVERRIREHNLSDIEATQKTFERKIQPQYEEFRRKLLAKRTGFWSRVVVAGGKFMQVDATPMSIRFLGAVLEMFGVSIDEFSKSEQESFLSNKAQAFNYIATLEDRVSKIS